MKRVNPESINDHGEHPDSHQTCYRAAPSVAKDNALKRWLKLKRALAPIYSFAGVRGLGRDVNTLSPKLPGYRDRQDYLRVINPFLRIFSTPECSSA